MSYCVRPQSTYNSYSEQRASNGPFIEKYQLFYLSWIIHSLKKRQKICKYIYSVNESIWRILENYEMLVEFNKSKEKTIF